jgi:hypothetical protein
MSERKSVESSVRPQSEKSHSTVRRGSRIEHEGLPDHAGLAQPVRASMNSASNECHNIPYLHSPLPHHKRGTSALPRSLNASCHLKRMAGHTHRIVPYLRAINYLSRSRGAVSIR